MSIALRFYDPFNYEETSSILYFNSTTRLSRSVSAEVPRYPVDRGVDMGDHYVPSNYRYNISGVISRSDVSFPQSLGWARMDFEDGESRDESGYIVNVSSTFDRVEVVNGTSVASSFMRKLLPSFLGGLIGENLSVQVDEQTVGWSYQEVRQVLEFAVRGMSYNKELGRWDVTPKAVELIKLDKRGNIQEKIRDNLLITSIVDDESAERGDALYLDLELEEVRTSDLQYAELTLPKSVSSSMEGKVKGKDNKGREDSAETTLEFKTLARELPEWAVDALVDIFTGGGR